MSAQDDFRATERASRKPTSSVGQVSGNESKGDTNKYDVSSLQYPADLDSSEEYGGHKVVFFINVPANSAVATGAANQQAVASGTSKNDIAYGMGTTEIPPNQYMRKSGDALKMDSKPGSTAPAILQKYKRLTAAISLYTPNALQNTYGVQWDTESMALASLIEGVGEAAQAAWAGINNSKAGEVLNAVGSVGQMGGEFAASRMLKDSRFSYAQKALGLAANPKQEQLFKSVDYRTFQFNFEFFPRNEQEAKNVLRIIRMFRYHMLPEYLSEAQFLYIYPSEFDIKYYHKDAENEYLEKQMTAVLTNMTINNTPNGQFMAFSTGQPAQINISLQFKELAVPTKETSPFWASGI